jgi:hypothetical protein
VGPENSVSVFAKMEPQKRMRATPVTLDYKILVLDYYKECENKHKTARKWLTQQLSADTKAEKFGF